MNKEKIIKIILAISAIILVAVLGSIFVNLGMEWYEALKTPSQWIAGYIIPIVWTAVYLSFGIILFLWIKNEEIPKNVVILLIINGILNILWCLTFFTLQQLLLGNIIIVINALLAIKLVFEISKTNKVYSLILSIYPTWVCIAKTFNLALWILN